MEIVIDFEKDFFYINNNSQKGYFMKGGCAARLKY
jgi:hypothetical protein